MTRSDAEGLHLGAKTEVQLSQGRNLAVSVVQYLQVAGHTEYVLQTTAASADGQRKVKAFVYVCMM